MKPHVLIDILNYGFDTTVLKVSDSSDYTEAGYNSNHISLDYGKWRSKGVDDCDIYTELYEATAINCCTIFGSNISPRASVVLAGSNASGVGGFNSPIFQVSLVYGQGGKWIYFGDELPSAKYYRITISDPDPQTSYFEIEKVYLGLTDELSLDINQDWLDSNESYQKRTITNGQWNQGTANPILKVLSIPFRSAGGLLASDKVKIEQMLFFIERVRTTRPFVLVLNPEKPELYFEYMTLDADEVVVEVSEAEKTVFNLTFKETK